MNIFIRQNTGSKDTQRQIYTTLSQDNIIFKNTPDTPGGIRFIFCSIIFFQLLYCFVFSALTLLVIRKSIQPVKI